MYAGAGASRPGNKKRKIMIDQQTVRTAFIHYRKQHGLSGRRAARDLGFSVSTLNRFERGEAIGFEALYRLAQITKLPINGITCDGRTMPNIKQAIDADPLLDADAKETLFALISVAYKIYVGEPNAR